ncbi:hypothetical protein ACQ3I4_14850 [Zafaria sp. Z1313]|uniref:hypothetical protein n=1 Tax=unclassified Zafaria TaxID=2828765 RepID=UPI002E7A9096|nr:hypothetical protein [Zafaria sp. J156]MEE1622532.1 hypothetical protein [Zafaria sp. J156]
MTSDRPEVPEVDWPEVPAPTGNADVDAALGELGRLPGLPVGAHQEVFEAVHDALRAALDADGER